MTRRLLRITLIGLVALVATAAAWPVLVQLTGFKISFSQPAISTSSANSVTADCTGDGVTLVIDPGDSAGTTPWIQCVKDFEGTGWDLFAAAGSKVEGTAQYPVGFVCRIDGYPTVLNQDCQNTPTRKQGTWVYFNMAAGAKPIWRFAMQGAATRRPECGSIEGWVFSSSEHPLDHPRVTPQPTVCDK